MKNEWDNARVLITGICGTVGKELLRQVIRKNPAEIIGLDNNESDLFFLNEEYKSDSRVHLSLGDVRDRDKLINKFKGVDVVLHAAALKHVVLCEQSPSDAVQTNILGTQNVIDAAGVGGVSRVIFTSSDKAVNPTNVMGTSKLMGERLMTAANASRSGKGPIFASTRFGNVLGSRGSVLPLFRRQIADGGPVTLTDPQMTRFVMTSDEAVRLVMDSVWMARGGEVFITKMPAIRIDDLAAVLIKDWSMKTRNSIDEMTIRVIGSKPGEKLYEELMNEEETRRTIELARYFVVMPAFRSIYESVTYEYQEQSMGTTRCRIYNSAEEPTLTRDALYEYLSTADLLAH